MACVIWCLVSLLVGLVSGFVIARLLDKRLDFLQEDIAKYKKTYESISNLTAEDVKLILEYAQKMKEQK